MFFFFFSSRRRHTILTCDWSSDVCSSDLGWYNGDLARRVWESGPVRGLRQKPAGFLEKTSTVTTDWGTSVTVPTDGWPAGSYLLRLDAHSGAQRYIPLTIRSSDTAGKVVLKNCVATW